MHHLGDEVQMSSGIHIVDIDMIPIVVRGGIDFAISEGKTRIHTSIIVRLLTNDDNVEGIGEIVCAPPGKPEELPEEILGAIENVVKPVLVGLDATERIKASTLINAALKGKHWTKAGINNAMFDLHAKAMRTSVSTLLGGPLVCDVPVMGTVIGLNSPDFMAKQAFKIAKKGYRAVKIKVGETLATDVARVTAVREAVGSNVALRVDANDHYQPSDAIRLIRAIERYDIEHVEQPISRYDILGMVEVKNSVGIPITTDDMVATPQDAMTVIRLGAADRVKIKVTKHGLDGARLISEMLAAAGMTAVLGHVFEMGLAAVSEAHLAASLSNLAEPHEIGSMKPIGVNADIILENLRPQTGFLSLPSGPGLGVNLDWDQISNFRASI
jgi:L-alanine-DL-glutamate epimerase-like enolase superfamily enzyme